MSLKADYHSLVIVIWTTLTKLRKLSNLPTTPQIDNYSLLLLNAFVAGWLVIIATAHIMQQVVLILANASAAIYNFGVIMIEEIGAYEWMTDLDKDNVRDGEYYYPTLPFFPTFHPWTYPSFPSPTQARALEGLMAPKPTTPIPNDLVSKLWDASYTIATRDVYTTSPPTPAMTSSTPGMTRSSSAFFDAVDYPATPLKGRTIDLPIVEAYEEEEMEMEAAEEGRAEMKAIFQIQPLSHECDMMVIDLDGGHPEALLLQHQLAQSPTASSGSICLDVDAFPHLFRQILTQCTTHTLTTILRCSRDTFDIVTPHLYRDITLDEKACAMFSSAATRGWEGIRGKRPRLEPDPLPSISRAVHQTRSISVVAPLATPTISLLACGMLPNLRYVSLSYAEPLWGFQLRYTALFSTSIKHLIVKTPGIDLSTLPDDRNEYSCPPILRNITILALRCHGDAERTFGRRGQTITLVLLPRSFSSENTFDLDWKSRFRSIINSIACWSCNTLADLEIVGLEYGLGYGKGYVHPALLRAELMVRQDSSAAEHVAQELEAREVAKVTFRTFDDWADEQEPGIMFDEEEERALRALSAQLRAEWGDTMCPLVTPPGATFT